MLAYTKIDKKTLRWVQKEVESTTSLAKSLLQQFEGDNKQALDGLEDCLHQVVGLMQILEIKSISQLILQAEYWVDDVAQGKDFEQSLFVRLLGEVFDMYSKALQCLIDDQPEPLFDIVGLTNQILTVRGQPAVDVASLFSIPIDVFSEQYSMNKLNDQEYLDYVGKLHINYQEALLQWLQGKPPKALEQLRSISQGLYDNSAHGEVRRVWWILLAYLDCIKYDSSLSKVVLLRQAGDFLHELSEQGESLVIDNIIGDLLRSMLFYIGTSEKRSDVMDEVANAFNLYDYFPGEKQKYIANINQKISSLRKQKSDIELTLLQPHISAVFTEKNQQSLQVAQEKLIDLVALTTKHKLTKLTDLAQTSMDVLGTVQNNSPERNDEIALQLATAVLFIDNTLSGEMPINESWFKRCQEKIQELKSLRNDQQQLPTKHNLYLESEERQNLLKAVVNEVNDSLYGIESSLENFAQQPSDFALLQGVDSKIHQIRGALQVLGEHKLDLLLQLTETQFTGIIKDQKNTVPALLDALAVAVGTVEEYINNLHSGQRGSEVMLDRSITDLETAIGKKVTKQDVEELLENSSSALLSWLDDLANFKLYSRLKLQLRDIQVLARQAQLNKAENSVKELTRLTDLVSGNPAYLTDNMRNNLQSNMGDIASQLIELYDIDVQEGGDEPEVIVEEVEELSEKLIHDDMDKALLSNLLDNQPVIAGDNNAEEETQDKHDPVLLRAFIDESHTILKQSRPQVALCLTQQSNPQNESSCFEAQRMLRRAFHTLKGSARMVELDNIGELAWMCESAFNQFLDADKMASKDLLAFSETVLDEIQLQVNDDYKNQHLIDVDKWQAELDQALKTPINELSENESKTAQKGVLTESQQENSIQSVFLQEARSNIQVIRQTLEQKSLTTKGIEAAAIALHTMVGGARTVNLEGMAKGFELAENACETQSQYVLNTKHKQGQALLMLLNLSEKALDELGEKASLDKTKWQAFIGKPEPELSTESTQLEDIEQENVPLYIIDDVDADESNLLNNNDDAAELVSLDVDMAGSDDDMSVKNILDEELLSEPEIIGLEVEQVDIDESSKGRSVADKYDEQLDKVGALFQELDDIHGILDGDRKVDAQSLEQSSHDLRELELKLESLQTNIDDEKQTQAESNAQTIEDKEQIESSRKEPHKGRTSEKNNEENSEDNELRAIFIAESADLYHNLDNSIAQLRSVESSPTLMQSINHNLHTLKGSARMMRAVELGDLTHDMESYLEDNPINNQQDLTRIKSVLESYLDEF